MKPLIVLLVLAVQAPVTITDERTVGASWRGPTGWQLGVWIAVAAGFAAYGAYLIYRWRNPRR